MLTNSQCFRRPAATLSIAVIAALLSSTAVAQQEPTTPESVKSFADSTFNSEVFKGFVSNYQRQNSAVINSVNDASVAQAKASLPRAPEYGTRIRYGTHNVVTNDGEVIVTWMIDLTSADAQQRKTYLAKLADLASRQIPEAMTFEGFVAEYGLFGEPQNVQRAMDLYRAAASLNYQPAIYDLAVAAAYGKAQRADLGNAAALVSQASAIAPDASYRVCGFGAFLSYRQGDRQQAVRYAQSCWSDLAGIPKALYDDRVTPSQKVLLLRNSIATGVDDGYSLLAQVTHDAGPEPQYLACKYMLVNRYRRSLNGAALKSDALQCYQQSAQTPPDAKEALLRTNTVVPGIIGFVPTEVRELEKLRASNRFHYAWSVPYLPFRQQDVDLFAPFVSHTKQ
jgi:hypothetical protein